MLKKLHSMAIVAAMVLMILFMNQEAVSQMPLTDGTIVGENKPYVPLSSWNYQDTYPYYYSYNRVTMPTDWTFYYDTRKISYVQVHGNGSIKLQATGTYSTYHYFNYYRASGDRWDHLAHPNYNRYTYETPYAGGYVIPFGGMMYYDWYSYETKMRFLFTGVAPNRVFIAEWYKIGWYYPSYNGSSFTFQCRLYEGSNSIEFHYGAMDRGWVDAGGLFYDYGSYGYYPYDALTGFTSYYPKTTSYINLDPSGNGNTGLGTWEYGKPTSPLSRGYTYYITVRDNATFDRIENGDVLKLTYGIAWEETYPSEDVNLVRGSIYGNGTTDALGNGDNQKPGFKIKQTTGTGTIHQVITGPVSFPVHPDYKVIYDATRTIPENTLTRQNAATPGAPSNPAFGANGNLDLTNSTAIKGGLFYNQFTVVDAGKTYTKNYYFGIALEYDLSVSTPLDPKSASSKKYPLTARVPIKMKFWNRGLNSISEFSATYKIYNSSNVLLKSDSVLWEAEPGGELVVGTSTDIIFEQFTAPAPGLYRFVVKTYYVGDQEAMNDTWPWAGQPDYYFSVAPEIEAEALDILIPRNIDEFGKTQKIYAGRPVFPKARFQNNGITDISDAPANLVIKSLPSLTQVYSDDILISDIPQGMTNNTADAYFAEFLPPGPGRYQVCVTVNALDDEVPGNNNTCDTFDVISALSGTYTIGPKKNTGNIAADSLYNIRNFIGLQEAVDALFGIGVSGPVTFEFTATDYNEGDVELGGYSPAIDMRSTIVGASATNKITFKPASTLSSFEGNVKVHLYSGSGIGFIFGQSLQPLNLNAVIHTVPASRKKAYANQTGFITFDGGTQRALKFILHTNPTTTLNAVFYFTQGASDIQVKNCIIANNDPANSWNDYSLPHTKFVNPQFVYERDFRSLGTIGYSSGIVIRSIPPQDDINFFNPAFQEPSPINNKNLDTLVNRNLLIHNNDISGFAYGVVALGIGPLMKDGVTQRYYNINNTYSSNYIHSVSRAGIFIGHEENAQIVGNKISGVATSTTGFNAGVSVGGILCGGERNGVQLGYNNIGLTINKNEISNIGEALNQNANNCIYGIKVEQNYNTYTTLSYPDANENTIISNNAIWGVRSGHQSNHRYGIRLLTERNTSVGSWDAIMKTPQDGAYFTDGDKIINNTVIIDNDGFNTTGNAVGIGIQQSNNTVLLNNAVAMLDDNNSGASNLYAAIFYHGIHPSLTNGIQSERNVYWLTGEGTIADSSALFRFIYCDENSAEIFGGGRNEFLTLNQWQMYTMTEDLLSVNYNFLRDLTAPDVDNPKSKLRIDNTPTWPSASKLNNRGERLSYNRYDIDGNERGTSGQYYDIGAFEFPGILLNSDIEVTTSRQPGAYRSTSSAFSDAEYIMTQAPVDIKAELHNNGSLSQSGVTAKVKVYREMPSGGYYDDTELSESIIASVSSSESIEINFNFADGIGKEFYPMTYGDWNQLYKGKTAYADSLYTVPLWFTTMANNVTPLYKIVIEVQADEDVSNNVYTKFVRFYLKRSMLNIVLSAENSYKVIDGGSTADEIAGKRNYDSLSSYLGKLHWYNRWLEDEGKDTTLEMFYDVFERSAWEPRAVNYEMYRTLLWSDSDEEILTRDQMLDIEKFVASGSTYMKKNLVIASQEMARINYATAEDFVKGTLRAYFKPGYPTDPLNGPTYNAGDAQPTYTINDNTRWIIGEKVGRLLTQYLLRTGILPADPDPLPGLMSVWLPGDGIARTAFKYNEAVVAGPTPKEATMGTSVTSLSKNIVYMGVDWRHFGNGEQIIRAVLDFLETNGGGVIPVELTSFNAEAVGNRIEVSWETASELNSSKFEVERSIIKESGATSYERIASVNAAGNSSVKLNYNITDKNVTYNTKYSYRLKMIDRDGNYEYSDAVEVMAGFAGFSIGDAQPNPASVLTTFEYTIPQDGNVLIEIFDISGKLVMSPFKGFVKAGVNKLPVDVSRMNSGVYNFTIKYGERILSSQLRIAR